MSPPQDIGDAQGLCESYVFQAPCRLCPPTPTIPGTCNDTWSFFDSEHCTSGTQLNAKDRLPAVYSTAALVDTSGAWVSKEAFQLLQQSPVFNGRIGVGLTWVPQDNLVAGQWRGIEAQGERQRFLEGHRREPGLLTLTNI